jgi:hypothetical protein
LVDYDITMLVTGPQSEEDYPIPEVISHEMGHALAVSSAASTWASGRCKSFETAAKTEQACSAAAMKAATEFQRVLRDANYLSQQLLR